MAADWSEAFTNHAAAVKAANDTINETAAAKDWSEGWRSLAHDLVEMAERSSDPWYWAADVEDFWIDLRDLWTEYDGPSGWSDLALAWGSSEGAAAYAEATSVDWEDVRQAIEDTGEDIADPVAALPPWLPWAIGGVVVLGVVVYASQVGKGHGRALG